ncbi:MAG: terminase small subunit [Oscillospiraceae bacterium]|nr:terminase small subunit [Oscillospiraceae bacterium]
MKSKSKTSLTAKEKLFCFFFAKTQNGRDAAIKAGYMPLTAERNAAQILQKPASQKQIAAFEENIFAVKSARAGLERLALGSINDAVKLAVSPKTTSPEELDKLDLYNISEIKVKDGAYEMKFFDRVRAFEKLAELEAENEEYKAGDFFKALEQGASQLKNTNE